MLSARQSVRPPPPPVPRTRPRAAAAATSFPPYTVVARRAAYDLRLYAAHAAITTPYTRRDEGFARLGDYLAGSNSARARFADAQPVVMRHPPPGAASPKTMTVHLGALAGGGPCPSPPPAPVVPDVTLTAGGGELVAVAKFSGYATPQAAAAARAALAAALAGDGVALAGDDAAGGFRVAQYGPLFSLEERTNEIMLGVAL